MEQSTYHPFRSMQAKEEYLAYYDQRAKGWPIPAEERMVKTSFGQTFVRISGPVHAPPLVLLPGSVFNSLMWISNIKALSKDNRTYAVDNIYDCGRSIYSRDLKTPEDFVQWLDELFTALGLGDQINLMGLSYGSWLTHQYALHFPGRLRKIVMLAHPAIVSANIGFIFRFLLAILSPAYFRRFAYWLLEDTSRQNEPLVEEIFGDMKLAATSYKPKATVVPKMMKDEQLRDLQVPALFLMGEREKTFSQKKAIQRLKKIAAHIQIAVIPSAGHDLNLAQADLVDKKVLDFLR
jgi:pimeloyl-ACP methyl ester carboxylesterase